MHLFGQQRSGIGHISYILCHNNINHYGSITIISSQIDLGEMWINDRTSRLAIDLTQMVFKFYQRQITTSVCLRNTYILTAKYFCWRSLWLLISLEDYLTLKTFWWKLSFSKFAVRIFSRESDSRDSIVRLLVRPSVSPLVHNTFASRVIKMNCNQQSTLFISRL